MGKSSETFDRSAKHTARHAWPCVHPLSLPLTSSLLGNSLESSFFSSFSPLSSLGEDFVQIIRTFGVTSRRERRIRI